VSYTASAVKIYNASAVKIYSATSSQFRFKNNMYIHMYLQNFLAFNSVAVVNFKVVGLAPGFADPYSFRHPEKVSR
jgi:hypothetical protein